MVLVSNTHVLSMLSTVLLEDSAIAGLLRAS